jgi:hypothetical protein
MPGMSLRGAGMARTGPAFTAATAAGTPSASGTTATQQAYGTAPSPGPSTARNGAIIAGVAGAALLVFLWSTLPR